MNRIKISGVDQFLHENQTWIRALDFYLQEIAFLKTRLSQVVDKNTGKDFVVLAERFNNSFIHNDECIKDLQKDIHTQQKLIKQKIEGSIVDENRMIRQQNKLRNEMGFFEKDFAKLKNEFNQYLLTLP